MKSIKKYDLTIKKTAQNWEPVKVLSSKDSINFCRKFYFEDINIYESTFICLLDQGNNIKGYAKISQGGVCSTVIDPIIVAKYAIDVCAKGVILCHNHPSGNTNPSEADKAVTAKIKAGLKLFEITLLDHIIITSESYLSFADEGLL